MSYYWGQAALVMLLVICIVVIRQIVGLPAYKFFYPLLFAATIHYLQIEIGVVALMFLVCFMSWIIHQQIANRFYLSLYAKYSLYVSMSLIFMLLLGEIWIRYGYLLEQSSRFCLMFLVMILCVYRIASDIKDKRKLSMIWYMLRCCLVYGGSIYLLKQSAIAGYFSLYPLGTILLGVCSYMLALYSGLQITEMYRFRKLIWSNITKKRKPYLG